ncbi:MAG: glutamate--tRNA ligase, partial [Longimicrobiales bacterium]
PKQILLCKALGRPVPVFGHLPMILGPDGKRLSKRHGATAVESYGAEGILPAAMVNFLALLGWSPGDDQELFSLQELVERFSMERVLKKGSVFDTEKLLWFNGQHLGKMDARPIQDELERSWSTMDSVPSGPRVQLSEDEFARLIEALKPRSRTASEMADQALPFVFQELAYEAKALEKTWYKDPGATAVRLEAALDVVRDVEWTSDGLETGLRAAAERLGVGAGKLFQPLRSALTGRSASPGIFDVLLILGRKRSIERLEQAIPMVKERVETPASE